MVGVSPGLGVEQVEQSQVVRRRQAGGQGGVIHEDRLGRTLSPENQNLKLAPRVNWPKKSVNFVFATQKYAVQKIGSEETQTQNLKPKSQPKQ